MVEAIDDPWQDEHIEKLEDMVSDLRDEVATLKKQIAKKEKSMASSDPMGYKKKYSELLEEFKSLDNCVPF